MHKQISLLSDSIALPGIKLLRRGVEIPPETPAETLPELGHRILAIRAWIRWGLGDFFGELVRRANGSADPQADLITFCADSEIDPKERRELLAVHTFYAPAAREFNLSYEHYREAMWGVDDGMPKQLHRAREYLRTAETNHWSVTELRRYIRTRAAQEHPTPTEEQTGFEHYTVVFEFRRFIAKQMQSADALTPEGARMILDDLGPEFPRFVATLTALASQPPPQ